MKSHDEAEIQCLVRRYKECMAEIGADLKEGTRT